MPPRGRRPAGAPDAREQILLAARARFAEVGFERTTMRAVARGANVDPSLIHHYFGDKEGLLVAALVLPVDAEQVLAGVDADPAHAGEAIIERVLGVYDSDAGNRARLLGLVRVGLSHEVASAALRDLLGRTVLTAVTRVVAPDHRELRASLVGTQVGGMILGRYLLGVPALRDVPAEQLVSAVGPTLQRYLTGPLHPPSSP